MGLVVSVDRMERGQTDKGALEEIADTYNMKTASIVNMQEVTEALWNREIDGTVYITDDDKKRIDDYYKMYGAKR